MHRFTTSEIRMLSEQFGAAGFAFGLKEMLKGTTLPNGQAVKMSPEQFSLRSLFEGLVGPVDEHMGFFKDSGFIPLTEAAGSVGTANFASAVGQLIGAKLIEGYNSPGFIGDELVDDYNSTLKGEQLVGFTGHQRPVEIPEGDEYPTSTFEDKYVVTNQSKKGLRIDVTEEAITHDQTGMILSVAGRVGESMRQERERVIVRGVCDVKTGGRKYTPDGTTTTIFSAANKNLLTSTPLTDWTAIQAALAYHAANQVDDRADNVEGGGEPVLWVPNVLLTSAAKAGVAARIVGATQVGAPGGNTSEANAISSNPVSQMFPGLKPLYSLYLDLAAADSADDLYDDDADWFLGNFKRGNVWKTIWPVQVRQESIATRDIAVCYLARYYGGLVPTDHRQVLKGDDS